MNWRDWPDGIESVGYFPSDICPVCYTKLRPIEIIYQFPPDWLDPIGRTLYTAICPKCRTKYFRNVQTGAVTISPDAEALTDLEERVRTLEETLSRLITWIHTQHTQPRPLTYPKRKESQEAPDDAEEFTRKYRYLL